MDTTGWVSSKELLVPPTAIARRRDLSPNSRTVTLPIDDPLLKKSNLGSNPHGQPYRLNNNFYSMGAYNGVKDNRGVLQRTYAILRQVPRRNPIIAIAINKKSTGVARFAKYARNKKDPGFEIAMRDENASPSQAAMKRIEQIRDIVMHGGIRNIRPGGGPMGCWSADGTERADGLHYALRKLVRDSLTLDACAFRIEEGENSAKYPIAFWTPVDASLIRFAQTKRKTDAIDGMGLLGAYNAQIRQGLKDIDFVMLQEGGSGVQREFSWSELAWMIRNPRSEQSVNGYGYGECEQIVDIIGGIINGIQYNTQYFDSNHIPPGLLSLTGKYGDDAIDDFKEQLKQMCGPEHFWGVPIIVGEKGSPAEYVPLRGDSDKVGMYWKDWLNFCVVIVCAMYQMDPSEIGFESFGQAANPLGNASPASRIETQQETGFEPLLTAFATMLNENIVERIDADFYLRFTGLKAIDEAEEQAESSFRMTMGMSTPNQELARYDEEKIYDPLDEDLYDICVDTATKQEGEYGDSSAIKELARSLYKSQGGKWAKWPNAPINCPGAMAMYNQEHGLGQEPDPNNPEGGPPIESDDDNKPIQASGEKPTTDESAGAQAKQANAAAPPAPGKPGAKPTMTTTAAQRKPAVPFSAAQHFTRGGPNGNGKTA